MPLNFAVLLSVAVVAFQSTNPDELYRDGIERYNAGAFEEAIQLLRRASSLRPNVPEYRYDLGLAYLKAGRARRATRELEAVLGMIGVRGESRLTESPVLVHLGTAYLELGNVDIARKRLALALARDSESSDAYYGLGLLEQKQGNGDEALKYFRSALEKNPDHPQANLALAERLREAGDLSGAREHLRHASHGATDDFEIQMAAGKAAYEEAALEDAAAAFELASRLKPEHADARFNLAR